MKKNMLRVVSVSGVLFAMAYAAGADVVFQENFDNSGSDGPLTLVGWHGYYGATAISVDEANTDYNNGPIISSSDFMFYDMDTLGGNPYLLFTDEAASFGSIDSVTNISFLLRNQSSSENIKVAIRVEGDWYVSQDVFNSPNSTDWAEQNLAVQDALWNSLTVVAGSSLTEGGSASLPLSGTVTAVGIFDASGTSSTYSPVRMDSFVVEGDIPEVVTEVLFREDFTAYSDTSLQNFSGWHAYYTDAAVSVDETNTDFNNGPIVSGSIGATGTNGFLFYDYDGFGGEPVLIYSDKRSSFGAVDQLVSIEFSLYNQSAAADLKVALKVDNNWYVSQAVFNGTGSWAEQSLDVQTASWNSLSFTDGSTLSEGGSVSLPQSGTVVAVGLFDASGISGYTGRTRIDSYVVKTLPFTGFDRFVVDHGLSGVKTDDDDGDGLYDWGEYVFGGNPTNSGDVGTLPLLDSSGDYVFHLIGDDSVVAHVLTNLDLVNGSWGTNATVNVSATNGVLNAYTNHVANNLDQLFIKLIID